MRTARRGLLALALGLFIGWTGSLPNPAAAQDLTARNQAHKIKVPTSKGHLGDPRARASTGSRSASASNLMVYNGGRVAHVPQVYLSFWGPEWDSDGPAKDYLNSFFAAVGGSDWLGSTTQYCSGQLDAPHTACVGRSLKPITNPPGQLKGTWNDRTQVGYSTPATTCGFSTGEAGDCDVMLAAARAATHFSPLPEGAVIMVLTPSGRSQPGFASGGWCAYHWAVPIGGPVPAPGTAFGYVPYQPDAGGSCGANSVNGGSQGRFDGFSIIGGHEYAEAITDPYPGTGWMDAAGAENADKCAWLDLRNALMGGRAFAVQPLWSNATGSCVSSTTPPSLFRSLGGILTSAPAAASWSQARLDVFARGTDNGLWHAWSESGAWSGWEKLGGVLTSEPTVAAWGPNRLDVFARGSDRALWHRWWGGSGWSDWERIEASLKSGPAVASWSSNRLDVFAQGPDDALWHRWWDGSVWSGWEQLGGVLTSSPATVAWGPDRIDVFVRGTDNALWHKWWWGAGWSGWSWQGGTFAAGAAASSRSRGRLDLLARRTDGTLWRQSWDGGGWTAWSSLGGQWTTSPAAVSRGGASSLDVFVVGGGRDLQYAALP